MDYFLYLFVEKMISFAFMSGIFIGAFGIIFGQIISEALEKEKKKKEVGKWKKR